MTFEEEFQINRWLEESRCRLAMVRGIVSRPRLSDYAKTFAMGGFWFASLLTIVVAIGSLT